MNIIRCSRCGENHNDVEPRKLARQMDPPDCPVIWTHWLPCPTNGDQIMIAINNESDGDIPPGRDVIEARRLMKRSMRDEELE